MVVSLILNKRMEKKTMSKAKMNVLIGAIDTSLEISAHTIGMMFEKNPEAPESWVLMGIMNQMDQIKEALVMLRSAAAE